MGALGERAILFTAAEAGAVVRVVVSLFRGPVPAASDADEGGWGSYPFNKLMAEMIVWADCYQSERRLVAQWCPQASIGPGIQKLGEGLGRLIREDVGRDLRLTTVLVLGAHWSICGARGVCINNCNVDWDGVDMSFDTRLTDYRTCPRTLLLSGFWTYLLTSIGRHDWYLGSDSRAGVVDLMRPHLLWCHLLS